MDEGTVESNGSCAHVVEDVHEHGIQHDHDGKHDPGVDLNGNSKDEESLTMVGEKVKSGGVGLEDGVLGNHSKAAEVENSGAASSPTQSKTPGTMKGYGLKKWRRIRRDVPKDATPSSIDSVKMLKRGSPGNVDVNVKQPSEEASVSSTNAVVQAPVDVDGLGVPGSSSNYSLPVNPTFSAGADSDNSEDRSSKSSTAASVPKHRHEAVRGLGNQRDKHRAKSVSGKNSGGLKSQSGKALDPSKKARGDVAKMEKEHSISSVDSDSRSYNSVFVRGANSGIGGQSQSRRPVNHEVDEADDEVASEDAEGLTAHCSKNMSVSQESSSDGVKGNSENHQLPRDCDPLVNSILMLQSAQAALEKELQQFGEIGKGIHSFCEDLGENTASPTNSVSLGPEVCTGHPSDGWGTESNHVGLNNDIQALERQLGEAQGKLKEKELKASELEATIKTMESTLENTEHNIHLQQARSQEMEAELESLFKHKVEAEVEFVAITESNKELTNLVDNHIKLLKEQKELVRELVRSSKTATEVQNKAVKLQDKIKEVDTLYQDSTGSEEVVKMQRKVVKLSKCFVIQLCLLLLVSGVFLSVWSPKLEVAVPT